MKKVFLKGFTLPAYLRLGRVAPPRWRFQPIGDSARSSVMSIRSKVQFVGEDFDKIEGRPFQPVWNAPRILRAEYTITHEARVSDLEIAEDCFTVFNAPDECLTSRQLLRKRDYRGYSLSVGDLVKIWRDGVLVCECLCCPTGWEIQYKSVTIC
jgi:hypothetical protein